MDLKLEVLESSSSMLKWRQGVCETEETREERYLRHPKSCRFGARMSNLDPNVTNRGLFKIIFQYILALSLTVMWVRLAQNGTNSGYFKFTI